MSDSECPCCGGSGCSICECWGDGRWSDDIDFEDLLDEYDEDDTELFED